MNLCEVPEQRTSEDPDFRRDDEGVGFLDMSALEDPDFRRDDEGVASLLRITA